MNGLYEGVVEIPTSEGAMGVHIVRPDSYVPSPGVIVYQYIGGVTDGILDCARRLAAQGYACFVPELYWRIGNVVIDPDNRDEYALQIRAIALESTKVPHRMMGDAQHLIAFMRGARYVQNGPFGVMGYCMGGRLAVLLAAAFPEDIGVAVSLFGTGLRDPGPESLDTELENVRGSLFFGFGGIDPRTPPEFIDEFRALLSEKCKAQWELQVYEDADHGYAFPERPMYQLEAAEQSLERTLELLRLGVGASA